MSSSRKLGKWVIAGAPFVALAVAFWPVLSWWVARTADTSDDALGVAALAFMVVTTWWERGDAKLSRAWGWGVLGVIALYALTFAWAPNLVRALFAATALGVVVGRMRGVGPLHFGTWGLVAMTLPVLASLRFFLGYPLRWVTTQATALLLRVGGLVVETRGLALVMGPTEVWVDGPCSGVQMLWVGVFLAAALAFVFRLPNRATVGLFVCAVFATVAGNISRAAGVFYLESGILELPEAVDAIALPLLHELTGIAAFAVVAGIVASAGFWLHGRTGEVVAAIGEPPGGRGARQEGRGARQGGRGARLERPGEWQEGRGRWSALVGVSFLVIAVAAVVPFATPASQAIVDESFEGWPRELDGVRLEPRELSERDKPYLAGFPGEIAAFRAGDEDVLLRWVARPTRRLHSAADCYRGLGFETTPLSSSAGEARFRVTMGDEDRVVSETLIDANGKHYAEVGAWYWAAMLGMSPGPWLNVVRVSDHHHLNPPPKLRPTNHFDTFPRP